MANPGRIAVVDLGTNSTRLLVAEVTAEGAVETLLRRSEVTRLGEGVDGSGRLSDGAIARVRAQLSDYARIADEHGVERRVAVATSAVRDADNGPEFERDVRDGFGFDIRVLSGDEEARLTFLGATSRRAGHAPTLVIDVGGGSTELVVGTPGSGPDFHVSTQLGSVRQSERHLAHDPPEAGEVDDLRGAAAQIVAEGAPAGQREAVAQGIAVAGTATSLAALDTELEPYDPAKVDGYRLERDACERMLGELAALPLAERREVPGLHPDRAATIVAGAVILLESMRAFGLDAVEVSEADVMHGVALDALYAG